MGPEFPRARPPGLNPGLIGMPHTALKVPLFPLADRQLPRFRYD